MGTTNPGIPRRAIADGAVSPYKLDADLRDGYYVKEVFDYQPSFAGANGLGDPTGGALSSFIINTKRLPLVVAYGSASTIVAPVLIDLGLDLALDKGSAEDVEYRIGAGGDFIDYMRWSVQKNTGFRPLSVRAVIAATTVAEAANIALGWGNNTGIQVNYPSSPDDFFFVDARAGDVYYSYQEAGGGAVSVDSGENVVDATDFELRVDVKDAGAAGVEFSGYFNGKRLWRQIVDDTGVFFPLLQLRQGTTGTAIFGRSIEIGPQDAFDDFSLL